MLSDYARCCIKADISAKKRMVKLARRWGFEEPGQNAKSGEGQSHQIGQEGNRAIYGKRPMKTPAAAVRKAKIADASELDRTRPCMQSCRPVTESFQISSPETGTVVREQASNTIVTAQNSSHDRTALVVPRKDQIAATSRKRKSPS